MMAPIVEALRATETFGLIQVARLEWTKFEARSLKAVRDEYAPVGDPRITRLHLDHVPVLAEDGQRVEWESILAEAGLDKKDSGQPRNVIPAECVSTVRAGTRP